MQITAMTFFTFIQMYYSLVRMFSTDIKEGYCQGHDFPQTLEF